MQKYITLCVILFICIFFRRIDAFTNPQLWAEDFPIFFQQAEKYGKNSILLPYGGYLQIIPRLIAFCYNYLRIDYLYIPIFYNYTCLIITIFIALSNFHFSKNINIRNRILYATGFAFLPMAPDIFMTITNLHWITSLYLVNTLFFLPIIDNIYGKIIFIILLIMVCFSGPFSILCIPIVLFIILKERKRMDFFSIFYLLLIFFCGLIQLVYIINNVFYRGLPGPVEHFHFFKLIVNNIYPLFFFKNQAHYGIPAIIGCLLIFLFLSIFLIRAYIKLNIDRKYVLALSFFIWIGAFVLTYWPHESKIIAVYSSRYYFIPFCCIFWVLLFYFDKRINTLCVFLYILYFASLSDYVRWTLPDKHWKEEIKEYYDGKRNEIDVNPEGWKFKILRK